MTLPSARARLSDMLLRSKRGCKRPFITSIGPDCVARFAWGRCPRLRDGSPIAGYIERSVGFHVKIAIPGLGVHMHELPPLFHIESYGLEGQIEHAGIRGEQQPARLAF